MVISEFETMYETARGISDVDVYASAKYFQLAT